MLFRSNLRYGDVPSLRARGDASRLGLYGFKVNQVEAMRFYEAAARQGSAEAAFNVALNTLHATQWRPSEQEAKKILSALMTDTGAHYNANGSLYSQIYYVVGQVHEHGWAGKVDMGNAFLAYRASTRNSYVPGIYRYLSLLASSFPKMDAHEKRATQQEVNVLTGRWKWSFPGIMRLTGDFHAMGALGDFEGFKAQYHWRLAEHLVQLKPAMYASEIELLKSRVVKLAPLQEKRLDDAIKAAIRNNQPKLDDHPLQFATLCT